MKESNAVYLGLYGSVYPEEFNEDHGTARGSEGTKKLMDAIDEAVNNIRSIMEEYSDVGATDTAAIEHILDRFKDRFSEWDE